MSTARASSVFLLSYRNTVLNQSVCVFALGYFLIYIDYSKSSIDTFMCVYSVHDVAIEKVQ